jgi:hypothetical protein
VPESTRGRRAWRQAAAQIEHYSVGPGSSGPLRRGTRDLTAATRVPFSAGSSRRECRTRRSHRGSSSPRERLRLRRPRATSKGSSSARPGAMTWLTSRWRGRSRRPRSRSPDRPARRPTAWPRAGEDPARLVVPQLPARPDRRPAGRPPARCGAGRGRRRGQRAVGHRRRLQSSLPGRRPPYRAMRLSNLDPVAGPARATKPAPVSRHRRAPADVPRRPGQPVAAAGLRPRSTSAALPVDALSPPARTSVRARW